MKQTDLKEGDKVRYQPEYYGPKKWENGIVRTIPSHTKDSVFVVYNCGGDWVNYKMYTSALTNLRDLKEGWKDGQEN